MLCYVISFPFLFFSSPLQFLLTSLFPPILPLLSRSCSSHLGEVMSTPTAALLRLGNACLTSLDLAVTWSESRKVIAMTVCKIVAQNDDETLDLVTYE